MSKELIKFAAAVPLGSLETYIQWVSKIPMLSQQEEIELAEELQKNQNLEAAKRLVVSHLRFVVRIAKGYSGYGLAQSDLIQEGNIGLMKAVKRFDPAVGVRLVSFAVHWIKAEIHEFILKNWRIVKVATTKAQRKVFFNLRQMKKRLGWSSKAEVHAVAQELGVKPEVVELMEQRLNAHDQSFDLPESEDDEGSTTFAPMHYLEDKSSDPARLAEQDNWQSEGSHQLVVAMDQLDERSQDILQQRWLSDKKATLHELAEKYKVSAERVRQLENNALKKLKGLILTVTKLITINDIKKLIDLIGIESFFLGAIAALEKDFSQWQSFKKQPRQVMHYPHGVMELMPISNDNFYAVKYVNGHPYNPKSNKSTVVAVGLFAEVQHGYPLMISEMTLLTAIRTASASALAAKYLTNDSQRTMALIGTGAQAEFQTLAFHFGIGVKTIRYFDIDINAMKKFAKNLAKYNLELIACNSTEDAVNGADIITTATADKKKAIILLEKMLKPGMHINGIGGDCSNKTELENSILDQCKIVVEYLPQTQEEGEIQHRSSDIVYAELWELVTGRKKGRESQEEITLFDSVGFALEDYSILRYVLEKSNELNIGQPIDLVPQERNPKDLFGLLI